MSLEKTIEILTQYLPTHRWPPNSGLQCAMKLGIEAAKAVEYVRRNYPDILVAPLPGETHD